VIDRDETGMCHYFNNLGFIEYRFSPEQLQPVRNEINKIRNDFEAHESIRANYTLVGNLNREYFLTECQSHLESLILPLIDGYDKEFDYSPHIPEIPRKREDYGLHLPITWVNFQKKGEFNPNHNHGGIFSFVLYINVPYLIEHEMQSESGKYSNRNIPGHFEFTFTNSLGAIQHKEIPIDKRYENTLLLFPSRLVHCVYPFYTSDDYRISVSGNFRIK
jgi:hypothetical protein